MGPYHGSQFTLHKEDPRLLSRIMPHFEAHIAQGDVQPAFRFLTGGHVWSEDK